MRAVTAGVCGYLRVLVALAAIIGGLVFLKFHPKSPIYAAINHTGPDNSQARMDPSATTEKEIPSRKFVDGHPHVVYILSYQRCGSSFFGQIFGQHPDVFYVFEPLDALYVSLYGTSEGWNVPSDITNFANGSQRFVPDLEKNAVAEFLHNIFQCQTDKLPTEALVGRFWESFVKQHSSLAEFLKCRRTINPSSKLGYCLYRIAKSCGGRLTYENDTRVSMCLDNMNHTHSAILQHDGSNLYSNKSNVEWNRLDASFREYGACLFQAKAESEKCATTFENLCVDAKFRAVKTVRGTMESVENLLQKNQNLRVIHLIRDPRAVVLSRKKFGQSVMGIYSLVNKTDYNPRHRYSSNLERTLLNAKHKALSKVNSKRFPLFVDYVFDVVREARLYCNTAVRDVLAHKKLERTFPGAIMQVLYDDFVKHPLDYTEKLYKFIDVKMDQKIQSWVVANTDAHDKKTNASYIAHKWEDGLTFAEVKRIDDICKTFYQEVPYQWIR